MMADRHSMKRTLMIFLSAFVLISILGLPVYAEDSASATSVSYVDASGKDMGSKDCLPVAQTMTEGWYVADGETFEERIKVKGDVNLILADNKTLNAKAGIDVPSDDKASLTIWAQSTGKSKGKLVAVNQCDQFSKIRRAGIGGQKNAPGGSITINGGEIQADGSKYRQDAFWNGGPGIDANAVTINGGEVTATGKGSIEVSGAGIAGKQITINGGIVNATGGHLGGAGIGGNYKESGGNITINGGDVTAHGGDTSSAGIGSGDTVFSGSITINGGTVRATGVFGGAGIGGSRGAFSGTVDISGGTVIAEGGANNYYSGAGIGSGPGTVFDGTVNISGGIVTATGGKYSAGIGAGWGGNARDGHINISDGTVICKGGEGAAGIGGGKEVNDTITIIPVSGKGGEGCDDVRISGGTVFAQSGAGGCSAIGHGDNDSHMGSITFKNGMCVKADNRTDGGMDGDYERGGKPFPWQGKGSEDVRESACQYRHTALIQKCDHPLTKDENDGFVLITKTTHLRSVCAYCKQPAMGEDHTFDENGKCTVCSYEKELCTVSFDADGGTGTMGVMKAVPGKEIKLPECGFTAPEGKAFAGWNVNGKTVDENKPVKIDGDTVVKAVWADAVPLWVGDTQVTVVNAEDILGDGTARYSASDSGGTLILDGAKISARHVYDAAKGLSAGITSLMEGQLKIVVENSSTVNGDADYGIYSAGPLSISGQSLTVRGREAIVCDSSIDISEVNLAAAGSGSGCGIGSKGDITISDSRVNAKTDGPGGSAVTAAGSISLGHGLSVVSPSGGSIGKNGTDTVILDQNREIASQALISSAVPYKVWVGQIQVTSDNAGNVLGDGRVSYDPDKRTLTFTEIPTIEGTYKDAMIYAEHDLTIVAPSGGMLLDNTNAAQGISVSGDLTLLGNVRVDVEKQAIFAGGDLTTVGDLTARGMESDQITDCLIEANGSLCIDGNLSGYKMTGSGLTAGGNISVDGKVFLRFGGTGIYSKEGSINVMSGNWTIINESGGAVAMDAVQINIPETHGILEPVGAMMTDYTDGGLTRTTISKGPGSNEAAESVTIGLQPGEGGEDPAEPTVIVTPMEASMTYGGAAGENRVLSAVADAKPESAIGTLRFRWQRQEVNGCWQTVASDIYLNQSQSTISQYTIPEDLAAGEYTYRCLVTNILNGKSEEAASKEVGVTIGRAAAKIVAEPRAISLTYNGKPQRLAMRGSASGGTMLYSLDGESWTSSVPTGRNAGDYTLYYMVQADENHNDLDGEQIPDGGQIEVTIAKRKLVITAEPKEKNCGEEDPVLTYLVEGLASGDKLVGQLSREAGEAMGTYLISSQGIEPAAYCKGNYTLVCQGDVLKILPSAGQVTDIINALPAPDKVKLSDKNAIREARAAYDSMTPEQKALVPAATLKKLTDDEAALAELQKKAVKTVSVNVKTVNAKAVNSAVAKAGGSSKYVTTIVLGKKVKKISKGAFKNYKAAKTLVVKTKKLKKGGVKKSLKGSKITKIKVKVGSKKINKKYVKKYKKIFTKKITGKKVKVSL